MRTRKVDIISVSNEGNHLYECSTNTDLKISAILHKFVGNNVKVIDKFNKTNMYFTLPQNNHIFKNKSVVRIYGEINKGN